MPEQKSRVMCGQDLVRDLALALGATMSDAGIPRTEKGRRLAVLTLLDLASKVVGMTALDEHEIARLVDFFRACLSNQVDEKHAVYVKLLGADVVREEHTHYMVDFTQEEVR